MNSLLLHRLVKVAPFAMAVFSIVLVAHGVHVGVNGDPTGTTGPNLHAIVNGDPTGNTGPN